MFRTKFVNDSNMATSKMSTYFVDIDECDTGVGTHNCSNNGTCADVDGSYSCSCDDGYTGDGFNCTSKYTTETSQQLCNSSEV